MILSDLLGYPLDEALETARAAGLRVDRIVMTSARGSVRLSEERLGGFEERVIACGKDLLIAGRFRTSHPAEREIMKNE